MPKAKGKPRGRPFVQGFDPRRHLLTRADREKGYRLAPSRVKARIRLLYRAGRVVRTGQTVYHKYEECVA